MQDDYNPAEERCADCCSRRCRTSWHKGDRIPRNPRVHCGNACFWIWCGRDAQNPGCCRGRWGLWYFCGRRYDAVRKYMVDDLRIEKVRILIVSLQMLAAMRHVFHILWPERTIVLMSYFDIFLLDLLSMGGIDCWTDTTYYRGLVLVLAWPAVWYDPRPDLVLPRACLCTPLTVRGVRCTRYVLISLFYLIVRATKFTSYLDWLEDYADSEIKCVPLGSVWKGKIIPKETELMRIRARKKELEAQLAGTDLDAENPYVAHANPQPLRQCPRLTVECGCEPVSWHQLRVQARAGQRRSQKRR